MSPADSRRYNPGAVPTPAGDGLEGAL
jgi:hypothetical protein